MATRLTARQSVASEPSRGPLPYAIAIVLLAGAATSRTAHAEWDFTPRARIGGEYSDNRNLARPPQQENSDWLATGAVGGQLEYFSPTASAWIEPILMYRHYGSDERDDSIVGQVLLNSRKSTEHTTWRLNGEYELFDSVMSQLPGEVVDAPTDPDGGDPDIGDPNGGDTGNVDANNDRQRLWLNPSVDYRFTESSSVRLALQSQRVRYDTPSNGNSDYDDDAVFITYLHRLSQRTRFNVTATASSYESFQFDNNVDTVGAFGYVRHTLSESTWVGFVAGLYRSEIDFGDPLVADTTENGWEGGVEFGGNTELSTWDVRLGQSLVPSATGLPVERTELRFRWEHDFSERISGDINVRAFHNAPGASSINNNGDRDYLWSSAQVSWQWTPTLTLSLGGTYRQQEYEVDSGGSNATSIYLNLEYQGLGRAQD